MISQATRRTMHTSTHFTVKSAFKSIIILMAFVLSLVAGQIPVAQAAGINFDRVDTEARGAINFGALSTCQDKVYTPVADADGNLRVIHSSLLSDNLAALPQHDNAHVAGAISEVEVARLNGCNFFVTATRGSSNMLKLVSWFSGANGVDRLGDSGNHGMVATEIALARAAFPFDNAVGRGYVIAAVRGASGHLVMSVWDVDQGNFQQEEVVIDELATQITMVAMPPRPEDADSYVARVVTAFKNSAGNLKLILWQVDAYGGLHRIADSGNQAGNVQQVAIAQYNTDHVITAVKNSDGNLQMVPWRLYPSSIDRLEGDGPEFNNPFAGTVQEIDITPIDFSHPLFEHVVTAVRTADGNLRLVAWGIDPAGNVTRMGSSDNQAGAASKINVEWAENGNRIITSMRDGQGNLRIVAWRVLP